MSTNLLQFDDVQSVLKSNLLNEILNGHSFESSAATMKKLDLSPLGFDLNHFYMCITGMKHGMYIQMGKTSQESLMVNIAFFTEILKYLESIHCQAELVLNYYHMDKLLVFFLSPAMSNQIEMIAWEINERLQRLYEKYFGATKEGYCNYTVLSGKLTSFEQIAETYPLMLKTHDMSYFHMFPAVVHIMKEQPIHSVSFEQMVEKIDAISFYAERGQTEKVMEKTESLFELLKQKQSFSLLREAVYEINKLLYRTQQLEDETSTLLLDDKAYAHIELLEKDCFKRLKNCTRKFKNQGQPPNMTIIRTTEYIRRHYTQDISLGDIAAYVGISPQYLSSLFNENMGKSIPTYIMELRMYEAKRLLRTTDETASKIARRIGISNVAYFYSAFKAHTGQTARAYRASCRKQIQNRMDKTEMS